MVTTLHETGSTNDWLLERAPDLPDGQWLRAQWQTAGRGRRGRAWVPVPGNLYASVLVKPRPGEGPPQQLSFVAALALGDAAARWVAAERLALKWPNDLLLDGVKVAGILLEGAGDALVIGFGVNLAGAPEGLERPATSFAAAGPVPDADAFVAVLESAFAQWRARWAAQGFDAVRSAWLARAAGLGEIIKVRLGERELDGVFAGLAADGALELRQGCETRLIHAGEVFGIGEGG